MRGKLLLVDDESVIRKGMRRLIESNQLGWMIVGEAGNGEEALVLTEQLQPDLILTDIRMPLMDGLELAASLHETQREVMVIILTGYRDFDYAQTALRYGVKEFLLKPCKEKEMCRVLGAAHEQFIADFAENNRQREAMTELENQWLRSMLLELPYPYEDMNQLMERMPDLECWVLEVQSYYPSSKKYGPGDNQLLQFAVDNILGEWMTRRSAGERRVQLEFNTYGIFLTQENDNERWMGEITETISRLLGIELLVSCLGGWDEVMRGAYSRLRLAPVAVTRPVDSLDIGLDQEQMRALMSELTSLLLLGRDVELQEDLRHRKDQLLTARLPLIETKKQALCLAGALNETARTHLHTSRNIENIGAHIAELQMHTSLREVGDWITSRIEAFETHYRSWRTERNHNVMDEALLYIEEHYMEECTLAGVAGAVNLSPNYFGNLFKKEMGQTFSAHLANYRIGQARLLLSNTDTRISEIAPAVGYADANYFATVFKQRTGLSPSDYRKMYKA
ncbi:response regulator transcription factor [Paenibacillus sp. 1P07SE]|uniref:response regulator transcription factor n=1 Tax=Paenibacillus sp. 1P07SE TaxID=3132209 RepID=UPI0039A4DEA6